MTRMTRLVPPDPDRYDAWSAALDEYGDGPFDGSGYVADARPATSRAAFAAYLEDRLAHEDPATVLPVERVHCSFRWIVDDAWTAGPHSTEGPGSTEGTGELLGFLAVRHALTPWLRDVGGHVGYSVRPAARGRGVATRALAASLAIAADLGIDDVLVTCTEDNRASRSVIERNGGVYEDSRQATRRYWIRSRGPAGSRA